MLPMVVYNRSMKEESTPGVTKVWTMGSDIGGLEEFYGGRSKEVDRERQPRWCRRSTIGLRWF